MNKTRITPIVSKMVTLVLTQQECFTALLSLTQWAWSALKLVVTFDQRSSKSTPAVSVRPAEMEDFSRIIFVCRAALRLIRFYVLDLYPSKNNKVLKSTSVANESLAVAHTIADVRAVLRAILSDSTLALLSLPSSSEYFFNDSIRSIFRYRKK